YVGRPGWWTRPGGPCSATGTRPSSYGSSSTTAPPTPRCKGIGIRRRGTGMTENHGLHVPRQEFGDGRRHRPLTPHEIRNVQLRRIGLRKGYDPAAVDELLQRLAD